MERSSEEFRKDFDDKLSAGDLVGAEAVMRHAVATYPDDIWLSSQLLHAIEKKDGPQEALAFARTMLKRFPNAPTFYEALVRSLTSTGSMAEAEALSEKALKLFPDDVWIKVAQASIYNHKQDWPTACQKWGRIVNEHPDLMFAYEFEINALSQRGDDIETRAARYAIRWPDSRMFPALWADYPMKRHNRFAAAQRWADVARAHKNWPDAAYHAAELFSSCNDRESAITILRDCVARDERYYTELFNFYFDAKCYDDALAIYREDVFPRTAERLAQLLIASNDVEALKAAVIVTPLQIAAGVTSDLLLRIEDSPILAPTQAAKISAILPDIPGLQDIRSKDHSPLSDMTDRRGVIVALSESIDVSGSSLSQVAADVKTLLRYVNAFTFDRRLRAYQTHLCSHGTIDFTSTLLESFHLVGSARILHSSLAICATDGSERAWLATAGHGAAHEICLVYFASADLAFVTADMSESEALEICRLIREFETEIKDGKHGDWCDIEPAAPLLLIGHNNFAHFVWNELPALCELERLTKCEGLRSAICYEPFGPMHFTVPQISEVPDKNLFCNHICFYASSIVTTDEARSLAVQICRDHAVPVLPLPDGTSVWISLRLMYRHPVNQVELIKSLCNKFEEWSDKPTIIIDGFSTPPDIDVPGRYDIEYMYKHRDAVCDIASEIMRSNKTSIQIVDTSMLNLSEVIAALSGMPAPDDVFYVSIIGTQQHKLAWLCDIPGITHANRAMAEAIASTEWQQTQARTKMESILMPHNLIVDAITQNERQEYREFRDYAFGDVETCATWISNELVAMRDRESIGRQYRAHLAQMS